MSSSSSDARPQTRNESRETRSGQNRDHGPLGATAVVPENPQSFSTVHSFGYLAASDIVGARGVVAHAIDDDALSFYRRCGFLSSPLGERRSASDTKAVPTPFP
jgi:hypothetical protein